MNVAVDCLRDGCASEAKESGIAIQSPSACVLDKCRDPLATLVSSADTQRCALCLFANYNSYEPMESIRARCGGQVTGGTGFRGQSGVLLLSKFPIGKDASFRVLPFVNVWRTTILRAPITLPNGAQLDVYCTTAASVLDDCTLSRWIGPYGKPATDCVSASRREQLLHFKNITDFVRQESVRTRRKAIVSGDFYAGPAGAGLAGLNEDNFATLTQEFSLGIADNFTPQCTFCSDNPIQTPPGNPPVGQSTWTRFNFLVNIAKSDVLANDTLLKAPLVKANPGNGASAIPLSQYYGFRSLVRLRP
jgi:hypothetical protein